MLLLPVNSGKTSGIPSPSVNRPIWIIGLGSFSVFCNLTVKFLFRLLQSLVKLSLPFGSGCCQGAKQYFKIYEK